MCEENLHGKTRILVTHHVHLLNQCDHIIILSDGRIKAQGTFHELQNSGVDINNYVEHIERDVNAEKEKDEDTKDEQRDSLGGQKSSKSNISSRSSKTDASEILRKEKADERHADTAPKLTTLEERN